MAAINDLINQIENPELRAQIQQAVEQMNKQKKFGLVFEEHRPEYTPLYDIPVRKGSRVAIKTGKVNETYVVLKLEGDTAICLRDGGKRSVLPMADLVSVAKSGEVIYPYLKPIDSVCNAPDSDLWHTLIEADNYHALQLIEYLYAGEVDCIYIDPPYNTGAKDWKYNNDYVDSVDTYRHSKWLSMMQRRLKIAKKLLNPQNSVMIVTIDEKEYLHLGCLLEEMFPEANLQMISSVINPQGVQRKNQFSRTDEYIFIVQLGNSQPCSMLLGEEWSAGNSKSEFNNNPRWSPVRRMGSHSTRQEASNQFYPIYVESATGRVIKCGDSLPLGQSRESVTSNDPDISLVWPMRPDGNEGCWQLSQETVMARLKEGYIRVISKNKYGWIPTTLASGEINKVKKGIYKTIGRSGNNHEIQLEGESNVKYMIPGTQWRISSHIAGLYGNTLIKEILGNSRFSFPKSLYAVHDVIDFFVADKHNALIVDFFAGSGTTLHAVNLLNAEDGGHRRCILVTNNEVSDDEAKTLTAQGYHPGDAEWEKLGIARYVTWPRTVCSIEGHDVNGEPLKGNYLGSDIPMADGFKANAIYFKLSFLNKTDVALGRQFKEMLPTLWMKAGAHGPCPKLEGEEAPTMLVLSENRFAVLTEESAFPEFEAAVNARPEIETVYIVTDYEAGYRSMAKNLSAPNTYQLYRDYLDHFRINIGRN